MWLINKSNQNKIIVVCTLIVVNWRRNEKHFIQVFALFILEFEFTSYTWDDGFLPGFFFFFLFIYVTIQDRGDIIGYYYSTLGNSFVPCFSCRKQQENKMFVFLVTKQLQKTTTLFSCRKHKKTKNEIDVHSLCLSPYLFDFWDSKNGRTLNKKRNLKSFGCWSLSWSLSAKQNKQWAKSRTADMREACDQKSTLKIHYQPEFSKSWKTTNWRHSFLGGFQLFQLEFWSDKQLALPYVSYWKFEIYLKQKIFLDKKLYVLPFVNKNQNL